MNFPVIISFYTKNTPYETQVQSLISSCKQFHLAYEVEGIDSQGSWELNCAFKPFFILKQLEKWNQPLLWVDADGIFCRKPRWQKAFQADLSVRIEDLPWEHPSKVISSTIFVRPEAKDLIRDWIEISFKILSNPNRKEEFWDQMALRDAIYQKRDRIIPLPLSYAKIFDHPKDQKKIRHPVIEHYQASRLFKKMILF